MWGGARPSGASRAPSARRPPPGRRWRGRPRGARARSALGSPIAPGGSSRPWERSRSRDLSFGPCRARSKRPWCPRPASDCPVSVGRSGHPGVDYLAPSGAGQRQDGRSERSSEGLAPRTRTSLAAPPTAPARPASAGRSLFVDHGKPETTRSRDSGWRVLPERRQATAYAPCTVASRVAGSRRLARHRAFAVPRGPISAQMRPRPGPSPPGCVFTRTSPFCARSGPFFPRGGPPHRRKSFTGVTLRRASGAAANFPSFPIGELGTATSPAVPRHHHRRLRRGRRTAPPRKDRAPRPRAPKARAGPRPAPRERRRRPRASSDFPAGEVRLPVPPDGPERLGALQREEVAVQS